MHLGRCFQSLQKIKSRASFYPGSRLLNGRQDLPGSKIDPRARWPFALWPRVLAKRVYWPWPVSTKQRQEQWRSTPIPSWRVVDTWDYGMTNLGKISDDAVISCKWCICIFCTELDWMLQNPLRWLEWVHIWKFMLLPLPCPNTLDSRNS